MTTDSSEPSDGFTESPGGLINQIEQYIALYTRYQECEEYHTHSTGYDDEIDESDASDGHMDFDEDKLVQSILTAFDTFLGEDDKLHPTRPNLANMSAIKARNQLRAELRDKLNKEQED